MGVCVSVGFSETFSLPLVRNVLQRTHGNDDRGIGFQEAAIAARRIGEEFEDEGREETHVMRTVNRLQTALAKVWV